jgi:hypothetical protein
MYSCFPDIHPSGTELALGIFRAVTSLKGVISMSSNLETKKYPFESSHEEKPLRRQKLIRTTLGDLIAAVTEEVKPFVRDPSGVYMVVSYIVNDVLARHRARKRSLRKYPSYLALEEHGASR